jgi:guanosine-3',5'-bis(diphosphate) 3'-pyrophosphohydrolase
MFAKQDSSLKPIFQVLAFAARKHSRQRRKDLEASPYINHPIDLAQVLVNEADIVEGDVICAALLHDVLEDTETSGEELEACFGPAIRRIVEEVSDDKSLSKEARKRLQIEHAGSASYAARLVKLADKLCNIRDILNAPPANWPLGRRREYLYWAKEVVDQIRGTHKGLEGLFDTAYQQGIAVLDAEASPFS